MTNVNTMSNVTSLKYFCCIGVMFLLLGCKQNDKKINQNVKTDTVQKKEPEKFIELEKTPLFPGGEFEMLKFIEKNLNKSIVSDSTLTKGSVVISFSVDTTGIISDFTIVRTYNQYVDKEFLRVLKLMPKWKSGENWSGNKNDSFKKTKNKYSIPLKIPFKGYDIED